MSDDVSFLRQLVRDSMEVQAQEAIGRSDDQEITVMKPLQVFHLCKTSYYADTLEA